MSSEDRAEHVRMVVDDIVTTGKERIFERLDELHAKGIHDDDVMHVLRGLGEHQLLDQYAEWGHLVDRCDPANGHHSTPHMGCILR